jgi:hypothetical protein
MVLLNDYYDDIGHKGVGGLHCQLVYWLAWFW